MIASPSRGWTPGPVRGPHGAKAAPVRGPHGTQAMPVRRPHGTQAMPVRRPHGAHAMPVRHSRSSRRKKALKRKRRLGGISSRRPAHLRSHPPHSAGLAGHLVGVFRLRALRRLKNILSHLITSHHLVLLLTSGAIHRTVPVSQVMSLGFLASVRATPKSAIFTLFLWSISRLSDLRSRCTMLLACRYLGQAAEQATEQAMRQETQQVTRRRTGRQQAQIM